MNPLLKRTRELIKEIKKIDETVFPLEIVDPISARPDPAFFKRSYIWKYIQPANIGYLTTKPKMVPGSDGIDHDFAGACLSIFDDNMKRTVINSLERKLKSLTE